MDVGQLVSAALGFLASYLTQVGSGLGDRVRQSVEDGLYQSIAGRLRQSERGRRAIELLEQDPSDPSARNEAGSVLEEECSRDPVFAADLERAIHFIQVNKNDVRVGPSGPDVTVGQHAKMSMRNSAIAGGNVDQSRRFNLTTNGIIGIILAVALLSFGAGTASGRYLLPSPDSPADAPNDRSDGATAAGGETLGPARGVGAEPCTPQPCASLGGIEMYLSGVEMFDEEITRYTTNRVLRFSWRIENLSSSDLEFTGAMRAYNSEGREIFDGYLNPSSFSDGCRDMAAVRIAAGQKRVSKEPVCYDILVGTSPADLVFFPDGLVSLFDGGLSISLERV